MGVPHPAEVRANPLFTRACSGDCSYLVTAALVATVLDAGAEERLGFGCMEDFQ